MDHVDRDSLARLPLLPRPPKPRSYSRRASKSWGRVIQAVDLANRAILGLQQLNASKLDDRLLEDLPVVVQAGSDPMGRAVGEHTALICGQRLPPSGRPQGDAALTQLHQGGKAKGFFASREFTPRASRLQPRSYFKGAMQRLCRGVATNFRLNGNRLPCLRQARFPCLSGMSRRERRNTWTTWRLR